MSNSYKKDEIYSLHYFLKSLHFDLTVSVPDNFTYFKFDLKLTLRFLNNWLFCFIAVFEAMFIGLPIMICFSVSYRAIHLYLLLVLFEWLMMVKCLNGGMFSFISNKFILKQYFTRF